MEEKVPLNMKICCFIDPDNNFCHHFSKGILFRIPREGFTISMYFLEIKAYEDCKRVLSIELHTIDSS